MPSGETAPRVRNEMMMVVPVQAAEGVKKDSHSKPVWHTHSRFNSAEDSHQRQAQPTLITVKVSPRPLS